jgi:hypothetical protein
MVHADPDRVMHNKGILALLFSTYKRRYGETGRWEIHRHQTLALRYGQKRGLTLVEQGCSSLSLCAFANQKRQRAKRVVFGGLQRTLLEDEGANTKHPTRSAYFNSDRGISSRIVLSFHGNVKRRAHLPPR